MFKQVRRTRSIFVCLFSMMSILITVGIIILTEVLQVVCMKTEPRMPRTLLIEGN